MPSQNVLTFFGIFMILVLTGMGIVKIWAPEAIDSDIFVKMVVTFGVLTVSALAVSFLSDNAKVESDEGDTKN